MKLKHAATISTALVVIIGISIVFPFFLRNPTPELKIILSFNILDNNEVEEWCFSLSKILEEQEVGAVVFITGKVAEKYPECVSCFNKRIDVGSLTYSYSNLTSISDYSKQLEEIRKGKQAIDSAGNLYSRSFRAPFGAVDDNIYSLLNRSDILADFSYSNHFNLFEEDKFIRYNANVYNGADYPGSFFSDRSNHSENNVVVFFDNTSTTEYIEDFVSGLANKVALVGVSEIAEIPLTLRGD